MKYVAIRNVHLYVPKVQCSSYLMSAVCVKQTGQRRSVIHSIRVKALGR